MNHILNMNYKTLFVDQLKTVLFCYTKKYFVFLNNLFDFQITHKIEHKRSQ